MNKLIGRQVVRRIFAERGCTITLTRIMHKMEERNRAGAAK